MKNHRIVFGTGALIASMLTLAGCATAGGQSATPSANGGNSGSTNSNSKGTTPVTSRTSATGSGITDPGANKTAPQTTPVGSGSVVVTPVQSGQSQPASSSSPFPKIIRMAMGSLPSSVLKGAIAPTLFPLPTSGSTTLYYQTLDSTMPIMGFPGFLASYEVRLSAPQGQIADFTASRYGSKSDTSDSLQSGIGNIENVQGDKSTVQLGNGHTGTLAVDKSNNTANIVWSEGRWHIRVSEVGNTTPPIAEAKEVVAYLQSHFLPVPHDVGNIIVDAEGSDIHTNVVWQESNEIYGVDTKKPCKDPVQTALAMVISMRNYS